MGHKVHPYGYRLGVNKNWSSVWFAGKKTYRTQVLEDIKIREFLKKRLFQAGIANIGIERMGARLRITLNTSRPGIVIGKKGAEIEKLKKELKKFTDSEVLLVIREVKKPEINAQLVAENIAMQIQRRIAFRRAMKKAVLQAMKSGALGIKVACAGRLAGADMARTEWYIKGRVPLQTLRADIDYGTTDSLTTYGIIGVKVWVFTGEIVEERNRNAAGVE
ncbi:30S ribosomal protein S3 [Limisalsivibrio acetivorans]|uniref:30S ribosomal protein S3 n=1 Tax=Limisalsivibrio acetivorans TaxID=1304888 RepID=UPI0003B50F5D|nr:30S ribosomal protein S3 [Limisalsivibrio acetivorans]